MFGHGRSRLSGHVCGDAYNDEVWGLTLSVGTLDGWSITIEPVDGGKADGIVERDSAAAPDSGEAGGCAVSGESSSSLLGLLLLGVFFLRRRR